MVEIFKLIIDLKEVQKVSLKCHKLTNDLIFSKFQTSDFLATSKGFEWFIHMIVSDKAREQDLLLQK